MYWLWPRLITRCIKVNTTGDKGAVPDPAVPASLDENSKMYKTIE